MSKSVFGKEYRYLYKLLTKLREDKKLSQRELSEKLGMYSSYVSKYELGERSLNIFEVFQIARALEIDELQFVTQLFKKWNSMN